MALLYSRPVLSRPSKTTCVSCSSFLNTWPLITAPSCSVSPASSWGHCVSSATTTRSLVGDKKKKRQNNPNPGCTSPVTRLGTQHDSSPKRDFLLTPCACSDRLPLLLPALRTRLLTPWSPWGGGRVQWPSSPFQAFLRTRTDRKPDGHETRKSEFEETHFKIFLAFKMWC